MPVWNWSRLGFFFVQFPVLVPFTLFLVLALGLTFNLPPGPLCDEGMVLFMEGGCDWGDTNIFFFSKLGLLLSINLSFLVVSRLPPLAGWTFIPHLLLLGLLGLLFRIDPRCHDYYSHPNGSIGQMAVEGAAFAILGLALVGWVREKRMSTVLASLLAWNLIHVGLFYLWLPFTDHWTWLHTALLCGSMVVLGLAIRVFGKRAQIGLAPHAT